MVFFWTQALAGKTPHAGDWTVIGAWKHVCDMTQPPEAAGAENVARSIYWPECFGDYIYGYGPQTDPDRDPEDPLEQGFLLEDDHHGPIKP